MLRDSKLARLLALLLAMALFAAACGSDDGDDEGTEDEGTEETTEETTDEGSEEETTETTAPPAPEEDGGSGGTLIWAHEQEPPDLHVDQPGNGLSIANWIRRPLLEGLHGVDASTSFYPELLAQDGEVVENEDGTVTINFVLRDGLTWSNGDPLTTADVEYTWNIWSEGCALEDDGTIGDGEGCVYLARSRQGYDQISSFDVASETEFSITFVQFFAGWKSLFEDVLHPSFGADAAAVNESLLEWSNADGPLVSSGPMIFDSWDRGVSMSLVRNDGYHGTNSPDARNTGVAFVDGVQINFVADTDSQINALKAEEAHIIMTQPQLAFGERLATDANFTVASTAGPVYEHWGFNLLNPHLSDPLVREALAYALDKGEVIEALYAPLFGELLPVEGLGNTYWMSNQPDYEDHQTEYAGANIEMAQAKLEEAGYTAGDGDTYEHPERGPLSLRVGTTGGNALRELQQQLIQAQMAAAGIEIVIDNVDGGAYFTEVPFSEQALAAANSGGTEGDPTVWDITQFAWVGGPWPGGNNAVGLTGSGNNPYGYSNADFDAGAPVCDATIDDAERAACYNELDRYFTTLEIDAENGLFMLPLTQKPSFYGYLSSVLSGAGVAPDADAAGPLTNVVDFQFAG